MKNFESIFFAFLFFILSCSSEIDPSNPFDPDSPRTMQAKGELSGVINPEDSSDLRNVTFTVTLKDTSYNAIAERDGTFRIQNIEPGSYYLRIISSDSAYYDTELGPINISMGQKTYTGPVSLKLKKGIVRGFIKKTDEKTNTQFGAGNIRVSLFSKSKKSGIMPSASTDNCATENYGRTYSSVSQSDGSFVFENVRVGYYRVNSSDELYGLGVSETDIEVKENSATDAGNIILMPPSALIRIEDEKISGKVISVTNSERVKAVFYYGDFLRDFKIAINKSPEESEWQKLSQTRSEIINLKDGEGEYEVFLKFRDIFCRETPLYSARVFLDKSPPVPDGIILPDTNDDFISTNSIRVRTSVTDNYSDYNSITMRRIIVSSDELPQGNIDSSFFESRQISYSSFAGEFSDPVTGKSGRKALLIQFKDEAGNESAVYK
ncbi:MAG: carboxypeptidase-like regulatory domain-containing protein, partial [Deltaproteobacteria bacterium]|nr:carboxypeptidase-like regulatory domain-containing protein [Deltaproteobacteria bacterium]